MQCLAPIRADALRGYKGSKLKTESLRVKGKSGFEFLRLMTRETYAGLVKERSWWKAFRKWSELVW